MACLFNTEYGLLILMMLYDTTQQINTRYVKSNDISITHINIRDDI